jgi:rhodanese-related sulfurtransferase
VNTHEYLRAKLAYEVDVTDAASRLAAGSIILVDARKQASWDHGHAVGAAHLPIDRLDEDLTDLLPRGSEVVVYGWGPGCNGATHTALLLAERGYSVREMIGGFEYWCRNGLPVESASGPIRFPADPLVTAGSGSLTLNPKR